MKEYQPDFIVIDDDLINNILCRKVIHSASPGSDIFIFTNPFEGLRHINSNYIHSNSNNAILLLDINMPDLSGWDVLEEIKPFHSMIKKCFKIFMLSSSIDPIDIERANINPLVSGYIEKPLTSPKLKDILSQCHTMSNMPS